MGWSLCQCGNGGQGGGNYTDSIWDGSLVANTYIDASGNEISYNDWSSTDYIDVSGVNTIYYCGNVTSDTEWNYWYDSSKNPLSRLLLSSIITRPNNAVYVRFSKTTSEMQNLKLFTEV